MTPSCTEIFLPHPFHAACCADVSIAKLFSVVRSRPPSVIELLRPNSFHQHRIANISRLHLKASDSTGLGIIYSIYNGPDCRIKRSRNLSHSTCPCSTALHAIPYHAKRSITKASRLTQTTKWTILASSTSTCPPHHRQCLCPSSLFSLTRPTYTRDLLAEQVVSLGISVNVLRFDALPTVALPTGVLGVSQGAVYCRPVSDGAARSDSSRAVPKAAAVHDHELAAGDDCPRQIHHDQMYGGFEELRESGASPGLGSVQRYFRSLAGELSRLRASMNVLSGSSLAQGSDGRLDKEIRDAGGGRQLGRSADVSVYLHVQLKTSSAPAICICNG